MIVSNTQELKPCRKCGSLNILSEHIINVDIREDFKLWLVCKECGNTSEYAYTTLLEALKYWNEENKI